MQPTACVLSGVAFHGKSSPTVRQRTLRLKRPRSKGHEVLEISESYGLTTGEGAPILGAFETNPKVWVHWMMRLELGLKEPHSGHAMHSVTAIAASYLLSLAPYMLMPHPLRALRFCVAATILALAFFC